MVHYSLDQNTRPAVYFGLALVSMASAYGLASLVAVAHAKWLAPSAFSIFALLVWSFDRHLWRWRWFMPLHGIPDLTGIYIGTVERGIKDSADFLSFDVEVRIEQTWTQIGMALHSGDTASSLSTCGLFISDKFNQSMQYTYVVEDLDGQQVESKYGLGAAKLYIESSQRPLQLRGIYFGTKQRKGVVRFQRTDRHTSHRAPKTGRQATMTSRAFPYAVNQLLHAWWRAFWIWNFVHYTLGLTATVGTIVIAAQQGTQASQTAQGSTLGIVVAICAGILTFSKAGIKANAYIQAWRIVNTVRVRYELDPAVSEAEIGNEVERAEMIIGKAD